MPLMVTCQNCGHPFPSAVLQVSRDRFEEEERKREVWKKYSESCPKCKRRFEYYPDNFFWKDL